MPTTRLKRVVLFVEADHLDLEDGDDFLLEDGDQLTLEAMTIGGEIDDNSSRRVGTTPLLDRLRRVITPGAANVDTSQSFTGWGETWGKTWGGVSVQIEGFQPSVTQRVTLNADQDLTKRVLIQDAMTSNVGQVWGGTWGSVWGNSWGGGSVASGPKPQANNTKRITEAVV